MYIVMQAVTSIRDHLEKQQTGALRVFAEDVWLYNNPVDPIELSSLSKVP
jgi:hypothetical protein